MTAPLYVSVDHLPSSHGHRLRRLIDAAVPSVAPALALAVWRSGAPWFDAHAGWRDPETADEPLRGEALFDLASLTKLFTATAFLQLVRDRRVGLDDAVAGIIPEFGRGGPRGVDGGQEPLSRRLLPAPPDRAGWTVDPSEVTFGQLLTHCSGMAPWRSVFREAGPVPPPRHEDDPVTVEERCTNGLAAVFGYPFVARPGTELHYSDLGFMTLGEALRRITGQPLEVVMQTHIRDRLGLSSLGYAPGRASEQRARTVPTSYDDDWRHRRCRGEVEDENAAGLGGVAGHAGLFATSGDVARFGVAWLRHDARLRLGTLAAAAITDQSPDLKVARGLGWQLQGRDAEHLAPFGQRAYGHTGFTGTSIAIDPDRDVVVVLLTNRVYAGRTHQGIDELRLALHAAIVDAIPGRA